MKKKTSQLKGHLFNSNNNISYNQAFLNFEKQIKILKDYGALSRQQILKILQDSNSLLRNQPNVLNIQSPVQIVGDIHGQFYDLLSIFKKFGSPPEKKYLFLGDYVDRGMFCIQVITLLLLLKTRFPNQIFLLRGNHETRGITTHFNFKEECKKLLKQIGLVKYDALIYEQFINLFSLMPLSCIVDKKIFAVHAGISPQLSSIDSLQKINRFMQPNEKGLISDLLWSDPIDQWGKLWNSNTNRLCSYYYTPYHSKKFLDKTSLSLIVRGHQVQMQGFKYQKTQDGKTNLTLTIFSAPNYCSTYKNQGSVLVINSIDEMKIQRFKSVSSPIVLPHYQNCFQWMMPFITENINKIMLKILETKSKNMNRRKAIIDRDKHYQVLAKIQQLEQIVFLEKILSQSVAKKNNELKQINQKQTSLLIQMTVQQFIKLRSSDNYQKKPHLNKSGFGPKLSKVQSKKFRIQQQGDQNLAPDFYEDFYQDSYKQCSTISEFLNSQDTSINDSLKKQKSQTLISKKQSL